MQTHQLTARGLARRLAWTVLAGLGVALAPSTARADGSPSGEQIYRQRCASCHGANGEGTAEDYPQPLAGEKSVKKLSKLIHKTMPSDDPGTCSKEDSDRVAAYLYDAFYSPIAQARNQVARIELSRLTVRQYRNAVTDLIASFRQPEQREEAQGLRAEYFKGRRFNDKNRVLQRIDPLVKFDFKDASPDAETIDPHEFSIRWEGTVTAPETGEYEFNIRSEHATRLWINDPNRPLIDAWVKSGDDLNHRGSITLLGGRAYRLKLEFTKANQGVDDSQKAKAKAPLQASIALEWTPPGQVAEPIPARCLSTGKAPEWYIATTPFPPDDRSVGYERGTSISKEWDQATTDAAIEAAGYVATRLGELAGVRDGAPDREAKLREFSKRFIEQAFRRPVDDGLRQRYIDRQFESAGDPATAVKRVVLLTLKSPRFLYLDLKPQPDGYDVASRLSFALWDSLPDRPLREAAASDALKTREQVARQAERMVNDPRTKAKLHWFLFQWLKVDHAPEIVRDAETFPGFSPEVVADLRTSLDLFLDDVVWSEGSDFRQILASDTLILNGRLAKFYGADLPEDAPFQKVRLNPEARAGVTSHPYLMATFAYTSATSPIHRGVFLSRNVLGRVLSPPPEAFLPFTPDLHPGLNTRERTALQTSPEKCMRCHSLINPLGFSLEHFDAVGRFRGEELGRSIDATGHYTNRDDGTISFEGARGLAEFLAGSDDARNTFVSRLFHALIKQPILAFGPKTPARLRTSFESDGFHIRKLVAEIAVTAALEGTGTSPWTSE
ncbi:MAG: DUF1592 domain-containing protein [Isosphaeraceae bacterium]